MKGKMVQSFRCIPFQPKGCPCCCAAWGSTARIQMNRRVRKGMDNRTIPIALGLLVYLLGISSVQARRIGMHSETNKG